MEAAAAEGRAQPAAAATQALSAAPPKHPVLGEPSSSSAPASSRSARTRAAAAKQRAEKEGSASVDPVGGPSNAPPPAEREGSQDLQLATVPPPLPAPQPLPIDDALPPARHLPLATPSAPEELPPAPKAPRRPRGRPPKFVPRVPAPAPPSRSPPNALPASSFSGSCALGAAPPLPLPLPYHPLSLDAPPQGPHIGQAPALMSFGPGGPTFQVSSAAMSGLAAAMNVDLGGFGQQRQPIGYTIQPIYGPGPPEVALPAQEGGSPEGPSGPRKRGRGRPSKAAAAERRQEEAAAHAKRAAS